MKNVFDPSVSCKMYLSRCGGCIITCPTCSTYMNYSNEPGALYTLCCCLPWWGVCVQVIIQHIARFKWFCPLAVHDGRRIKLKRSKIIERQRRRNSCGCSVVVYNSRKTQKAGFSFEKISLLLFLLDFSPSFRLFSLLPVFALDNKSIGKAVLGA